MLKKNYKNHPDGFKLSIRISRVSRAGVGLRRQNMDAPDL